MKYDIQSFINEFEEKYALDDACLHALFNTYDNKVIDWVIAKASALNFLYSAHVSIDDIRAIAKKIVACRDLDEKLQAGSTDAFYLIANKSGEQKNNALVFASKYCHFSNPRLYPIYDDNSRKSLFKIYNEEFPSKPVDDDKLLEDYSFYQERLDELLKHWRITGEDSYKKIDEFLWMYAKELCQGATDDSKE